MGFLEHAVAPAAKEIAISFALNFATMALGRLGANFISSALSPAGGHAAMLKTGSRITAIGGKMGQLATAGGTSPAAAELRKKILQEIARDFPRELLDEIKDEAVEGVLEQVLGAIDQRLTPLAALLNATGKAINLKHGTNPEIVKAVVQKLRVE